MASFFQVSTTLRRSRRRADTLVRERSTSARDNARSSQCETRRRASPISSRQEDHQLCADFARRSSRRTPPLAHRSGCFGGSLALDECRRHDDRFERRRCHAAVRGPRAYRRWWEGDSFATIGVAFADRRSGVPCTACFHRRLARVRPRQAHRVAVVEVRAGERQARDDCEHEQNRHGRERTRQSARAHCVFAVASHPGICLSP